MAHLKILGDSGESRNLPLPGGERPIFLVVGGEPKAIQITKEGPPHYLAALLHTGGHWLVLTPPGGADLTIDGLAFPAFKILDDGSVLETGGFQMRLTERIEEVLDGDASLIRQEKSCPWCQRPFTKEDFVIYCPTCGLAQHADCLRDGKKCGSYPFCGYTLPAEGLQEKASARP